MKKLITLAILSLFALTSKAQSLTFEETVKYINDQIACCKSGTVMSVKYGPRSIYAKKDGTFGYISVNPEIDTKELNITDLEKKNENDATHHNGIKKWYSDRNLNEGHFVGFTSANGKSFGVAFDTQTIQDRVFKAFVHLQSLCTPTKKDPFAN